MEKDTLLIRRILLEREYRTLSDLWEPKSKHKIHLSISKKLDNLIKELDEVKKLMIKFGG
jgi:hypothetical protein